VVSPKVLASIGTIHPNTLMAIDCSETSGAPIYDRIGEARSTPCNLWCGDEEARQVVEQLNRDAGYEPVYAGPLENAELQESFLKLEFEINRGGLGRFFYRMAPPDQL
jgi:8-hydroxy-5-deazaflavin:NADPH oxidoreductase